jgi:hypothetical protein
VEFLRPAVAPGGMELAGEGDFEVVNFNVGNLHKPSNTSTTEITEFPEEKTLKQLDYEKASASWKLKIPGTTFTHFNLSVVPFFYFDILLCALCVLCG